MKAAAPLPAVGRGAVYVVELVILIEGAVRGAGEGKAESFLYAVIGEMRRAGGGVAGTAGGSPEIGSAVSNTCNDGAYSFRNRAGISKDADRVAVPIQVEP